MFRCFSHCLLLVKGGLTAFLGPTGSIQKYFTELGFELPSGENVADWFIDIVSNQAMKKVSADRAEMDSEFLADRDLAIIWKEKGDDFVTSISRRALRWSPRQASSALGAENSAEIEDQLALALGGGMAIDKELTVGDLDRILKLNEIEITSVDILQGLYEFLISRLDEGCLLTIVSLVWLCWKAGDDSERRRGLSTINDFDDCSLQNRPGAAFGTQLLTLIQRNVSKMNLIELAIKSTIAALVAIGVALLFNELIQYEMTAITIQPPLTLFAIISGASFMYVFGDERLIFARESQTGFSVSAYWLAKNIVNLLDIFVISAVYCSFYYLIIQPTYTFLKPYQSLSYWHGLHLASLTFVLSLCHPQSVYWRLCLFRRSKQRYYRALCQQWRLRTRFKKF